MKARILPPEEWHRMERRHIPSMVPFVRPEDMAPIVVEDQGSIVACVSAFRATHFESLWIDPRYRKNPGVARPLLRQALSVARVWDAAWAFGNVESEEMRGFVERLGGMQVPLQFYVLPLLAEQEKESWPLHPSSPS